MLATDLFMAMHAAEDAKGLEVNVKLTKPQWVELFRFLGSLYRFLPFIIGDAVKSAEWCLGESAPRYIEHLRLPSEQILDFVRLASRWEERPFDLPWSYYRDAGTDEDVAFKLLQACVDHGWSREQLRDAKRAVDKALEEKAL